VVLADAGWFVESLLARRRVRRSAFPEFTTSGRRARSPLPVRTGVRHFGFRNGAVHRRRDATEPDVAHALVRPALAKRLKCARAHVHPAVARTCFMQHGHGDSREAGKRSFTTGGKWPY